MSGFTARQIGLVRVAADDPTNRFRTPSQRIVWRWTCPGNHADSQCVTATVDEPELWEADILADPRCVTCRRAGLRIDDLVRRAQREEIESGGADAEAV